MKSLFFISTYALVITVIVCASGILFAEAPIHTMIVPHPSNPTVITVGWVGDMVPSLDTNYNQNVFDSVAPELQSPDLMIGNLEGTFASKDRVSKCTYLSSLCHSFRGDPSFAAALQTAGFDFVSLVNNHAYDYGEDGLTDTEQVLEQFGIPYISTTKPTVSITIKGKRIGILGLSSTEPAKTITDYTFIQTKVAELKKNNDFVIVIFHGGAEGSNKTIVPGITEYMGTEDRGNVELVAHTAIDAGADLVLGSGPHVLRKIENYKNIPIAYSLGNFVGGRHLTTTGNLGISGIFTATLEQSHPTTYNFTSVTLSKDGIPSVDFLDQGKYLIKTLTKQ